MNNLTLAIIGSREFEDYKLLSDTVKRYFCLPRMQECEADYLEDEFKIFPYYLLFNKFVSGGAKGADSLGKRFCTLYNKHAQRYNLPDRIEIQEFIPDWDQYGKQAGFLRNEEIISAADVVLAFWNGSNGTKHSIGLAKEQKKPTIIIYF